MPSIKSKCNILSKGDNCYIKCADKFNTFIKLEHKNNELKLNPLSLFAVEPYTSALKNNLCCVLKKTVI